jgi:UDPglucose 6-dehydrogenase
MNEISQLCDRLGADIDQVRVGMGTDSRIGMSFLFPGIGYGGSCFPKDVQALIKMGKNASMRMEISEAVEAVNVRQKASMVAKIEGHFGGEGLRGKVLAMWGLAFKPRTDDTREAPALVLCEELVKRGAKIQAFDPAAVETFKARLGTNSDVSYGDSSYSVLSGADALIVCTEWSEFRQPNFKKIREQLRTPTIFDGRNIFSPKEMRALGFTYYSVGRPAVLGNESSAVRR